jgi:hypothetical protein
MSRPLRSVVVVGGQQQRIENLCDLLVDSNDYDVIVMESIARGYSRIKQVTPDFVIVLMKIDDVAAAVDDEDRSRRVPHSPRDMRNAS